MRDRSKLTLSDLDRGLRDFFLHDYHQRVHSETKCAPQERWEKGGFIPRLPEWLETLGVGRRPSLAQSKIHRADGEQARSNRDPACAAVHVLFVDHREDGKRGVEERQA